MTDDIVQWQGVRGGVLQTVHCAVYHTWVQILFEIFKKKVFVLACLECQMVRVCTIVTTLLARKAHSSLAEVFQVVFEPRCGVYMS